VGKAISIEAGERVDVLVEDLDGRTAVIIPANTEITEP
jgi:pyrimidine operon attenuation protein/uracil phosphoribosyltransferase